MLGLVDLVVFGGRPDEIKLYPFTKYEGFKFLQVNQSKDLHQGLIKPDWVVEESELEDFIKSMSIHSDARGLVDRVIVQGDMRTTFRAALYAFENKIPVVHIEAGLRTYDLSQPYPEEGLRQMIDRIATYRFCSTEDAKTNLFTEGLEGDFVGQTSIDTLFEFLPKDVEQEDFYIVTVHRTENWDKIDELINRLKNYQRKGKKLHIYAHPNKVGQELRKHFNCLDPLPYREFVTEMAKCKGFISDSGGLQEEAIALGKEFISLREKSERGHGETYEPGATERIVQCLKSQSVS